MFPRLLKKIYQQLILLVVVALVLAAAYVSIGRQFMPAISGYSEFLEEQLYDATGLVVAIESLSGEFQGFNPVININGLSLLVGDLAAEIDARAPLNFDSATIIVDVPRSIWQRRWVFEEFSVQHLELAVVQDETGNWQLGTMSAAGDGTVDPAELYQALQRVSRLDLRDVVIEVDNRYGDRFSFSNGSASIQNSGNEHFLHVDTIHDDSGQQLQFSFEAVGNNLDALDARLHLSVPIANYSNVLRSLQIDGASILEFIGGGSFWLDWRAGQILQSVATVDIRGTQVQTPQGGVLNLEAVRGNARLRRQSPAQNNPDQQSAWSLSLSQMTLSLEDHYWRPFNLHANYVPQRSVNLRADNINLALLAEAALQSGVLDDAARSQLLSYSPGGSLRNFSLAVPFPESGGSRLTVSANLDNVELGSVRGSPNMWGIDGFFEARFDRNANLLTGSAAVDSDNFSINIPNVFTQVWDYDYVNGALDFSIDLNNGQRVTLESGVIVAESDAVDGHIQFRSMMNEPEQGEREAQLDLMIGASRIDASQKSLYLPDGPRIAPNLRNSMDFLNAAIIAGDIYDSAVVFRGNTLPGTGPETKTFQGFFQIEGGEFNFNEQWPRLNDLSASVFVSDNDIDVDASSASSLELNLLEAVGQIRRNERNENWLVVRGQANGETAAGLDYIQAAPLNANLKQAFSDWQAAGDFDAAIDVMIPLSVPGRQPDVRLDMVLRDNTLSIDNLQLEMSSLNGPVVFDTRSGLERTELSAEFFGDVVDIELSSEFANDELMTLLVDVTGNTTPEYLVDWPRQSDFVRQLLALADGNFDYQARLSVDQTGQLAVPTQLTVATDFAGTAIALPEPFAKTAEQAMQLQLDIGFAQEEQIVSGTFSDQLTFQLDLFQDQMRDGLIVIGSDADQFATLADNETEGLAIIGSMDQFALEQWTEFVTRLGVAGAEGSGFDNNIAFADLHADNFNLYGQTIADVAFRIEPSNELQGWWARLEGESLSGEVVIPYDVDNHLLVDLEYLHLPGDPDESDDSEDLVQSLSATGVIEEVDDEIIELEEEVRVDPLLNIDPRELPPMRFSTNAFSIGAREFGSWQFTLDPTPDGAEFDDLIFDFRGLRLGMDSIDDDIEDLPAHFAWTYDGDEHRSSLTGVLTADDLGEVLLANGFAASLVSDSATFVSDVSWPGSPAFFSGDDLSGRLEMRIENGRFLQDSGGGGALKLVSIINFSAIMRRLRFSDDLLRRGLAFDEITGQMTLQDGVVAIDDRLVISGPSSLYQITGGLNLEDETIAGEMYVTLPVSDNIPWLGLLTANLPLAVGAYLFDQIFGDQVDSLTSAVYTLEGPWEGLQPEFKQAFGSPESAIDAAREAAAQEAANSQVLPPGQ